jgi:hypothetical protein
MEETMDKLNALLKKQEMSVRVQLWVGAVVILGVLVGVMNLPSGRSLFGDNMRQTESRFMAKRSAVEAYRARTSSEMALKKIAVHSLSVNMGLNRAFYMAVDIFCLSAIFWQGLFLFLLGVAKRKENQALREEINNSLGLGKDC